MNGTPAAALAGYGSDTKATQGYLDTMWDALKRRGWTRDQFERMLEKREAINSVTTKDSRRLWVVDWVTTLPEFRKLGLISKLLHQILQRGACVRCMMCVRCVRCVECVACVRVN